MFVQWEVRLGPLVARFALRHEPAPEGGADVVGSQHTELAEEQEPGFGFTGRSH